MTKYSKKEMTKYSKKEIKEIVKLLRSTNSTVMHRKYQVIFFHMKGLTNVKISELTTLHEKTVGKYVNTFKELGVEGLIPKKPSGRPSLLTKDQEKQLYETVGIKTPDEVGFDGNKQWTASLACQWACNEYGINYSINGMLDLFHRLGLSYTRPTYVLKKADPSEQAQFKEDFENIKKNSWAAK